MLLKKSKFNELVERVMEIERKQETADGLYVLDDEEKRKIAYALNVCTVSISQIIDYKDLYVLEQEYDAILNNINLRNFMKHDALLKVIKNILDTVNFFRIKEGDKKFIEKEYRQKTKNAIWKAIPTNIGMLITGEPVTSIIAAVTAIGTGYMNYRNAKNEALSEKEKQEWELTKGALEQFHGLRRDLFETAWRLSDEYDFPDEYRLTEKQITHYCEILKDPDQLRRYEKLDVISDKYKAYPLYWYHKGHTAMMIYRDESKDDYTETYKDFRETFREKALEAFEMFYQTDYEFFREDLFAASCAVEHISLLAPNCLEDRIKIEKLLGKALRLAGDNFDILQMCAVVQVTVLKQPEEAEKTLRRLVNEDYNISLNGVMLSRIYYIKENKPEHDMLAARIGKENVLPWIDDNETAEQKYLEIKQSRAVERFDLFAETLTGKYYVKTIKRYPCNDRYLSNHEKYRNILYFTQQKQVEVITGLLNDMFTEISKVPLFSDPEIFGLTFGVSDETEDTLAAISLSVKEDLANLSEEIAEVCKYINDDSRKMRYYLNWFEEHILQKNEYNVFELSAIINKINNLDSGYIKPLYEKICRQLKERFKMAFTHQTTDSVDSIINEIDRWYDKNDLPKPGDAVKPIVRGIRLLSSENEKSQSAQKTYFDYRDFINE